MRGPIYLADQFISFDIIFFYIFNLKEHAESTGKICDQDFTRTALDSAVEIFTTIFINREGKRVSGGPYGQLHLSEGKRIR